MNRIKFIVTIFALILFTAVCATEEQVENQIPTLSLCKRILANSQ